MNITPVKNDEDTIFDAIKKLEKGTTKIPDFQRRFVWGQKRIIELFESIYKGFPIGTILIWRVNKEVFVPCRDIANFELEETKEKYPVEYVLDGQQRLTALYGVLAINKKYRKDETDDKENDPSKFEIYFDLDAKIFVGKKDIVESRKKDFFNCGYLYDDDKYHDIYPGVSKPFQATLKELYRIFREYKIPIIITQETDEDQVATIFERINSTGEKLNALDLIVAKTHSKEFKWREKVKELKERLEPNNFEDIEDMVIFQCVGAVIEQTTFKKKILSLPAEKIRKQFDDVADSIVGAVDHLCLNYKIPSFSFVPRKQQIVPLAYYFYKHKTTATKKHSSIINKWFWCTTFSDYYDDATNRKMDDDIKYFEELVKAEPHLDEDKYNIKITENDLIEEKFSIDNPRAVGLLLLLALNDPPDLYGGTKNSLVKALSSYNKREFHHIFPKSFLKKINKNKRGGTSPNSICNICYISSVNNRKISDGPPSEYFRENVFKHKDYEKILEKNFLPTNKEYYKKNEYEKFIKARASLILKAIKEKV